MKAGFGGKGKSGGFAGNLVKAGGSGKKLALKSDMKEHSFHTGAGRKKGSKQAHKKV